MTSPARNEYQPSFPLAENQHAILFDQLARPDSPVYNIGGRLAFYGEVDHALLRQAIKQLFAEQEALSLRVWTESGHSSQNVRNLPAEELPFIDFSGQPEPEQAAELWLQARFGEAFDIAGDGLLCRFALLKTGPGRYALLTQYHHLIADGWSTKIVIDRLAELYNALLQRQAPPAADAARYQDFVEQETAYLASATCRRDAEFWQQALPCLPETLIKPKYANWNRLEGVRAHIHRFRLSRPFYDCLQATAAAQGGSAYHALLGGLCLYFARTRQRSEITVGIPALNRSGARFKKLVGMCASLSPLPVEIDFNAGLGRWLQQFSASVRRVHKHQRYPLGSLCQRLQLLKHQRDSLFDLVVSYERQDYSVRFGDTPVHARQLFSGVARYPLAVTICEFSPADDVEIVFEGAETCFTPAELAWLAERWQLILSQFIETPDCRAADAELLPAEEKRFILQQFNRPPLPQAFSGVLGQFKNWAARSPDAAAVRQAGRQLSFRELDHASDRLAQTLLQRGCAPGDRVAVCMPRCPGTIVALLAIFKIRAAYLPIDCDSPFERVQGILQQSRAAVLLTTESAETGLAGVCCRTLPVDRLPNMAGEMAVRLAPADTADDIAYVLYTSGSTGQPKGVLISQRALSARTAWLQQAFGIQPGDRVGQTVQTHFDPAFIEIFLGLTQGACLVLAPWQRPQAGELADFVLQEDINALALVPSSLQLLLQGLPAEGPVPLRVACCGGEVLPANLAKAFIERTGACLFNVYGPTEATILATAWPCDSEDRPELPIGQPLDDTQIVVLDRNGQLLPLGETGEIAIGGAGVGVGYLAQDAATEQAFIANPYAEGLMYRTGDSGYIGTDGQLYFCRRLDRQVKISGYRIEPGEIENLLLQHPAVRRAAVNVAERGHKQLLAYAEADGSREDLQAELAAYLRQRLPDYMQPKAVLVLDSLPLTAVGKIDYARLPLPDGGRQTEARQRPLTPLEAELLDVWRRTLAMPDIGPEDNFFELDTDSLAAINLIAALEKASGRRQSIAFLMAYPTVAAQAEQLAGNALQSQRPAWTTLSKAGGETHLFIAASGDGDRMRFQTLADALGKACSVHVLYPPHFPAGQACIDAIGREYARTVMQHRPQTFYLAGFSIGGLAALAAARVLAEQGHAPDKLILLDTVYPHWPLHSDWLFKTLQWLSKRFCLRRLTLNGRKLDVMLNDPGIAVQLAGLKRFKIRAYPGQAVLVMTKSLCILRRSLFGGWHKLFGNRLVSECVPGLHGAMFRPENLAELSRVLKQHLLSDHG